MKKALLTIVCAFSLFFCACNDNNDDFSSMSLMQLNTKYNELSHEYDNLKSQYDVYYEFVEGKSKAQIIELINELNTEVIKSNVMITNESKGYFSGTSVSSGSGTIIKEDSTKYYVLTNNHVIYTLNSNRTNYYVYDYMNNEYVANVEFYDPNYDMALLSFTKRSSNLRVAKLASEDLSVNGNLITIGQPMGQRNIITLGQVIKYDYVNCDNCDVNESNISYPCMYYDAITTNGNSGGMIINYNYEIVGVVTFGFTTNGVYSYGAGSSVSKVREFFSNNAFEVGDLYV